jgi:hypothetical protein
MSTTVRGRAALTVCVVPLGQRTSIESTAVRAPRPNVITGSLVEL